jgi:tetratricopeptide (TPR) repeat protein
VQTATTYDYDLGTYGRTVSTSSTDAQLWFDRGLVWCYAYNHEESVRCFRQAAEHDPECAMAYWGIAYAVGPNYNKAWDAFDDVDRAQALSEAHGAARKALELAQGAAPVEQALIEAVQRRYPSGVPVDDCSIWNDDYAAAMRDVYGSFPGDPDVAMLFAEALMNRTPWQLWDLKTGEPAAGADTLEAIAVLERALREDDAAGGDPHPGLAHMYVHLMEMSPHPERALPAADRLRDLVPDAGHLRHMPTHIDVLCGQYRDVVVGNEHAIVADRKFLEREGPFNFYSLYRCHDYHFKLYGAMFLGQLGPALQAADEMISTLPEELLQVESPPMADWLEAFVPTKMHVFVRFGRWQEIVDEPLPDNAELYCFTLAVKLYAKAIAHAALGELESAEEHRSRFSEAVGRVPATRYLFNNSCADILAVAAEMLNGEIEYRRGNHEAAFSHLRRSVELDDNLPYDEPWGWMQPARHALGALLLEQGQVEEAQAVYRADLGLDGTLSRACQHPDNVWSLHGLHECLTQLGEESQASILRQRLELAMARADVPIRASCYCRTGVS